MHAKIENLTNDKIKVINTQGIQNNCNDRIPKTKHKDLDKIQSNTDIY